MLLVLAEQPDAELPQRIIQLAKRIRQVLGPVVIDLVPSWTTLLVHYDLLQSSYAGLVVRLEPLLEVWLDQPVLPPTGRSLELPVWYAGEDLAHVARVCDLHVDDVIELHSAAQYRVGALGFAPGFAYMRELDARLALPRRSTPRTRIPAGSVAIAERQTAVYPQASPGGWHLLGLCPLPLFDLHAESPCLLQIGDCVRFVPVDHATYLAQGGRHERL